MPNIHAGKARQFLREVANSDTDECVLWPFSKNGRGYGQLIYEGKNQLAHRLVCFLVYGDPPSPKYVAAHGPCHNPLCVNWKHLRWATNTQNVQDRRRDGTYQEGMRHHNARLTDDEVRRLRELREAGRLNVKKEAEALQLGYAAIYAAAHGLSWKHVA